MRRALTCLYQAGYFVEVSLIGRWVVVLNSTRSFCVVEIKFTKYITRALHGFDYNVYIILNYCLILEKSFVNDLKLEIIYKFSCRKCYFLNV